MTISPARAVKGCHCLLIEDNKFDQKRIERILHRTLPSRLSTVETLADAYRALDRGLFDLVITDNALPDGLAVEFIRRLRNTDAHRDIPVIMMSDHPSEMIQTRALQAGVSAVVTKASFTPDQLIAIMHQPELTQA